MIADPVTIADVFRRLRLREEWVRWAQPFESAWATAVASCEDTSLLFVLYGHLVEADLAPPEPAVLCGCEQARQTLPDSPLGDTVRAHLEQAEAACRGERILAADLIARVRKIERMGHPTLTRPSEYAVAAGAQMARARECQTSNQAHAHALAIRWAADVWLRSRTEALTIVHRRLGGALVEGGRSLGEVVLKEEPA